MPDAAEKVHVVVTCTSRKTVAPSDRLRVRALQGGDVERRACEWIDRLEHSKDRSVPVRTLYSGEHWSVVKSFATGDDSVKRDVEVWVVSAGYGLLSLDAEIHPYAATFSSSHADTVGTQRTEWWRALTRWSGPRRHSSHRSLTDLVRASEEGPVLIALSPPYLDACSHDLAEALDLASQNQVSIISAGLHGGPLGTWLLPCDARLQRALGGSLQALNARAVSYLLDTHVGSMERKALADTLGTLLRDQPPVTRYDRTPVADSEVARFITDHLEKDSRLSHSRLLAMFRRSGRACEQARFRSVYHSVTCS